jgi:CRP-like cAMP-binding protein
MAIRLKVARTAKDLDDVFRLRYEVYVKEKGRFTSGNIADDPRIVDRFDAIPWAANIIAYDNDTSIACLRVNKDSEIGLPSETHLDFSSIRARIKAECEAAANGIEPVIVSGGMLAIKEKWRNRRSLIFALFKTAFGVMHNLGATHVIASISEETLSLYGRIGFDKVGETEWKESIGDSLIPMLAPMDKVINWAFGEVNSTVTPFWLMNFSGRFEWLLLSPGEVLFYQNDRAENAYAIENGWISISRSDQDGNEMVLSNLSKGALFGELAIFDEEPRSATAMAITNVELIVIHRKDMLEMIRQSPEQMGHILHHFSKRLRAQDDMTMVQAFAPQTSRIIFSLGKLWESAVIDRKNSDIRVAKVGSDQIALYAHAKVEEVISVLEEEKLRGNLEYGKTIVRFFRAPSNNNQLEIQANTAKQK